MNASPTYIHFRVQWQVIGPESPGQRFEREKFQAFFDKLNAEGGFHGYDDFSYRPERCLVAKVRGHEPGSGEMFSKVEYANDSLSIVEEWAEDNTKEFVRKMKAVLNAWFSVFPETLVVVQTSCIRALVTPQSFPDSREFVGTAVLRLGPAFNTRLNEMPHKVGFTFGCKRSQGENEVHLECAASSWRDNRSVWIDVRGVSPLRTPLNAARHDQAEPLFENCTRMIEGEMIPLLGEFDKSGHGNGAT